MPHATDGVVIDQVIEIISALIDKEIAYKSDDGSIYFSVDRFKEYGKLSGVDLAGTKAGARVNLDEYEKDNARDFVIWKTKQPEEPSWPAPFGEGRPGWHIECSAMAIKYLGNTIDLHAGGVDLVFPHHENEIAQSEAYTGEKFVKHWFHAEHLMVEGQKMSKSLNNIYTLDEMADKYRVEPIAFRMLVLSSHYRERLNFTNDSIIQAQNTLNNLRNFVLNNKESKAKVTDQDLEVLEKEFSDALNDDLNMPKAFAAIFDFIGKVNKEKTYSEEIYRYFLKIDQVLGLSLDQIMPDDDIKKLFESYKIARMAKNYKESDKLRKLITEKGWTTEDSDGESKLRKA
jgi:cysteinyl-tRNA synthetase